MTFLLLNGFCRSHRKFYRETLDREKFFYLVLKIIQDSFGLALPRFVICPGRSCHHLNHSYSKLNSILIPAPRSVCLIFSPSSHWLLFISFVLIGYYDDPRFDFWILCRKASYCFLKHWNFHSSHSDNLLPFF